MTPSARRPPSHRSAPGATAARRSGARRARRRRVGALVACLLLVWVGILVALIVGGPGLLSGRPRIGAGAGGPVVDAAMPPVTLAAPETVAVAPSPSPAEVLKRPPPPVRQQVAASPPIVDTTAPAAGPRAAPLSPAETTVSLEHLVERQGPAVVLVAVLTANTLEGIGSGFVVSAEGLVVTNHHVVHTRSRGARLAVRLSSGRVVTVRDVVAADAERDLAVLALDAGGLPAVQLGDSDTLKQGQRIAVIGHPRGLTNTVSDGIVSAFRSEEGKRLVQITAPISPGNSGGPVFDMSGRVVAVTVGYLSGGQNLNFGIPINEVRPLIVRARHARR